MEDMQSAAKMLDEALVLYRCLTRLGYWDGNAGKKKVGEWFGGELARFQNLMTSNSWDSVGLITQFYNGVNMDMLRNAYSDYKSSGCAEGERAVGKSEWTYNPATQQAGFTTRVDPFRPVGGSGGSLGDNKVLLMIIAAVVVAMMWGNKGGGGEASA